MSEQEKTQKYVDKWIQFGLSTEALDKESISKVVRVLYRVLEAESDNPKITFCKSPDDIIKKVSDAKKLDVYKAWSEIKGELNNGQFDADYFAFYDYIFNELNYTDEFRPIIEILMEMGRLCSFYYVTEEEIWISERPLEINRDEEGRLHADGKMAFCFTDGWGGYYWHGREMPELYGKTKSNQWQSGWLLTEKNAEIRRILLQQIHNNIGYGPMLNQLKAKKLSEFSGQDKGGASFFYELFRIDENVDVEPIHLLKMTCPTTGALYVHRVSPDLNTAEDAIVAVNAGIHPSKFGWQT